VRETVKKQTATRKKGTVLLGVCLSSVPRSYSRIYGAYSSAHGDAKKPGSLNRQKFHGQWDYGQSPKSSRSHMGADHAATSTGSSYESNKTFSTTKGTSTSSLFEIDL
jgi:hypothetical protein